MREQISRLMGLQTLDRAVRQQEEALSQLTSRVTDLRDFIEKSQTELEQLKAREQQAALGRKQMEKALAEGEAQIRTKRMRLNAIRNEKELEALSSEVESLKEHNQRLEAELISQMEAAEQATPRVAELSTLVASKKEELKAAEKEVAGELEQVKSALVKQRVERDKLAANIDASLRQRYEMIFKRRNGSAVALAKGGTCHGCRMRLPPQLYNEVQKFRQIHFCPNCQRILYFEEDSPQA